MLSKEDKHSMLLINSVLKVKGHKEIEEQEFLAIKSKQLQRQALTDLVYEAMSLSIEIYHDILEGVVHLFNPLVKPKNKWSVNSSIWAEAKEFFVEVKRRIQKLDNIVRDANKIIDSGITELDISKEEYDGYEEEILITKGAIEDFILDAKKEMDRIKSAEAELSILLDTLADLNNRLTEIQLKCK